MATTHLLTKQAGNANLDAVFDPYVTGTSPPATGLLNDASVDIASNIYAPIIYGTAAADTGLLTEQAGNADIKTLFAAKGTAKYTIPIDGVTYTQSYTIPSSGTGYAAINFRMHTSTQWEVYGNTPTNPEVSLLTGAPPAGAVTIQAVFGTVTTPAGYASASGTLTNSMSAATAISSLPHATLQSGTFSSSSGSRRSQVTLTINFFNGSGTNISSSTCTFIVDTEGSV